MLLTDKVALVYGAGGAIGGAIARAFAGAGAHVFLASRTPATLDRVARDIRTAGGTADTAVVDALDEVAVTGFVDRVVGGPAGSTSRATSSAWATCRNR